MSDTEITKIQINMAELKVALQNIEKKQDAMDIKMDKWMECADQKYAPAWVANAMKFVMGAVSLAVIGAILSLIIK